MKQNNNKNILHAPWRGVYVKSDNKSTEGCFLCNAFNENRDDENLLAYRAEKCFVILNLYPYNNGHVMIVPNQHIRDYEALSVDTMIEMNSLSQKLIVGMKKYMSVAGFNLGLNIGKAGGAGVPDHIHMHLVPRWEGDTNFMPIIGETKVISDSLQNTYNIVKKILS